MKSALHILIGSARALAKSNRDGQSPAESEIDELRAARELALRAVARIEGEILTRC